METWESCLELGSQKMTSSIHRLAQVWADKTFDKVMAPHWWVNSREKTNILWSSTTQMNLTQSSLFLAYWLENSSINIVHYRGVGNIRTGNIRTTLKIFGQCWKYSDDILSVKFSLEIFGQTFFAEKFFCRQYYSVFSTFDYFDCCRLHFDCLYFDYLSSPSASKAYYWIELDAKPKLSLGNNYKF